MAAVAHALWSYVINAANCSRRVGTTQSRCEGALKNHLGGHIQTMDKQCDGDKLHHKSYVPRTVAGAHIRLFSSILVTMDSRRALLLFFVLYLLKYAHGAEKGPEPMDKATASAEAKAQATSQGGGGTQAPGTPVVVVNSKATASASASSSSKASTKQVAPEALAAWRDYSTKCAGKNYNPKTTTPATCANLSGTLCSRKDVKCQGSTTQFLDASGAVLATGENESGRMM